MSDRDRQQALTHLAHEEAEHRLANLFQIVLSNLDRAVRSSEGAARWAIDDAADQVSTLFRLQQALGGLDVNGALSRDHFHALFDAVDTLLLKPRGHVLTVELDLDLTQHVLPAATLRGLSRAIVEAVINVAKHAFPAGPGGRVALRLSRAGGYLECSIVDDGIGGVAGAARPGSRGMALIDNLAQHAGARCRWVFGNSGTDVRILWPVLPAAPLERGTPVSAPPVILNC